MAAVQVKVQEDLNHHVMVGDGDTDSSEFGKGKNSASPQRGYASSDDPPSPSDSSEIADSECFPASSARPFPRCLGSLSALHFTERSGLLQVPL